MSKDVTLHYALKMGSFSPRESSIEAKSNEEKRAAKITASDIKETKKILRDFCIKLPEDWVPPKELVTYADLLKWRERKINEKLLD